MTDDRETDEGFLEEARAELAKRQDDRQARARAKGEAEKGREQEEAARDAAALELENTLLAKAAGDSSFATAYALLRLARMTEQVALAIDGGTFDLGTCIKDSADQIAEVLRNGIRVHSGEED